MDIAVRLDDPNSPEARALLQAAHELMQSLFPERRRAPCHLRPLRHRNPASSSPV